VVFTRGLELRSTLGSIESRSCKYWQTKPPSIAKGLIVLKVSIGSSSKVYHHPHIQVKNAPPNVPCGFHIISVAKVVPKNVIGILIHILETKIPKKLGVRIRESHLLHTTRYLHKSGMGKDNSTRSTISAGSLLHNVISGFIMLCPSHKQVSSGIPVA
jgi:hypothetical protein